MFIKMLSPGSYGVVVARTTLGMVLTLRPCRSTVAGGRPPSSYCSVSLRTVYKDGFHPSNQNKVTTQSAHVENSSDVKYADLIKKGKTRTILQLLHNSSNYSNLLQSRNILQQTARWGSGLRLQMYLICCDDLCVARRAVRAWQTRRRRDTTSIMRTPNITCVNCSNIAALLGAALCDGSSGSLGQCQ
ncbi:hypothetical protein J6590_020977 [Homalodisca vitripennis]|nr:hypothetical protein J6590_020977 [Homalodisca vitripennis]